MDQRYISIEVIWTIKVLVNAELDPLLWRAFPDMDVTARAYRAEELLLDLTGNLDSCA